MGFREKLIVLGLMATVVGGVLFWFGAIYVSLTKPVPAAGGSYTEGVLGQPAYVNPLFSQTSEADADLSRLVYAGLFAYDRNGRIREDMAEGYEISDEGRRYIVRLKRNVKWHDGEAFQADDALFTFRIIQDPAYKSPLRQNWQGVEVEQIDDYTLAFSLRKPYFGFLENLTVGILPKHVWEGIAPEKFVLAERNLSPVGSGPYQFFDLKKDSNGNILSYEIRAFPGYFSERPAYVSKIVFRFYPDEDSLVDAYNRREVAGMGGLTSGKEGSLQDRKSTRVYELRQPRLFAVFFNETKSVPLAQKEVRRALSAATNRQEIVDSVFHGKAVAASSPFLPQMSGYAGQSDAGAFDPEGANRMLEEAGWIMRDGVREKNGAKLEFVLTVPDWPDLVKTANLLRSQWERVGAKVEVSVLGVSDLQQNVLRPREYQALLFGEATSFVPDPYSFWHSSQKRDPGLNLSLFENKDVDVLLGDARETLDDGERNGMYAEFQRIFAEEMPAVFLYSPSYLYVVNTQVQGIDAESVSAPSQRFQGVTDWYVKTKRVGK
jgi:peptide/nickel transport system substrate-binding protein